MVFNIKNMFILIAIFYIITIVFAGVPVNRIRSEKASLPESGIDVIMTQNAANYIRDNLVPLMKSEFAKTNIPDIGSSRKRVYSIYKGGLSVGSAGIQLTNNGVRFNLNNVGFSGGARWKYKSGWFVRLRGRLSYSVSGNIAMTLTASTLANRPYFRIGACSANVNVRIRFRGFIGWLLNFFKGKFERRVRDYLNREICNQFENKFSSIANKLSTAYPLKKKLGSILNYDVSLTKNAMFANGYFNLPFVGITSKYVTSTEIAKLASINPTVPNNIDTSKMLNVRLKQHTINVALLSYFRANKFNAQWTNDDLSPEILNSIEQATISEDDENPHCDQSSNCQIQIKIYARNPPSISLDSNNIRLLGELALDINLINANTDETRNIFKLSVNGYTSASFWIKSRGSNTIFMSRVNSAEITSTNITVSPFGEIMSSDMASFLNLLIEKFIPEANNYLSSGMLLPQQGPFTFKDTEILIRKSYIEIGTNVKYSTWG